MTTNRLPETKLAQNESTGKPTFSPSLGVESGTTYDNSGHMGLSLNEEADHLKRRLELRLPSAATAYAIPETTIELLRTAMVDLASESVGETLRRALSSPKGQEICRLIVAIAQESQNPATQTKTQPA
jgi:hypothetical protein